MAEVHPIPTHFNFHNLTGMRFGRLVAVAVCGRYRRTYKWRCICDCGNTVEVNTSDLSTGHTASCGCWGLAVCTKHGCSKRGKMTAEYTAYHCMKARCLNPDDAGYPNYGGRGITICPRWLGTLGFEQFRADMGPRPSKAHSIDRFPNNDGNYEPGNCRWATRKQQSRNYRRNHLVTHDGLTLTLMDWSERLGMPYNMLRKRLHRGWSAGKAFSTPPLVVR